MKTTILIALTLALSAPGTKKTQEPRKPLPASSKAVSAHAPYAVGECALCHENADPKKPGKLIGTVNEICASCHEDFAARMKGSAHTHAPANDRCTNCHNAHDAMGPKLLDKPQPALCLDCHDKIGEAMAGAVKHGALEDARSCANCHDPHASSVEYLLQQLPFQLCLTCHGEDGLKDQDGKVLTNIKALLEANPVHHKPVKNEDCSACHGPHGTAHFRLLKEPYPAQFYAPFDLDNYTLCFDCHLEELATEEFTTTDTNFRDGNKNLHWAHVNLAKRGRTCRACHEVHASPQDFQIRDGVPYGSSGWMLKLHYKKAEYGGSCAKTCHVERGYDTRLKPAAPEKKAAPPLKSKAAKKTR